MALRKSVIPAKRSSANQKGGPHSLSGGQHGRRSYGHTSTQPLVTVRHRPNPRGQGGRLRQEIIEAASTLLAEPDGAGRFSLRGVAKHVGITATSVYLHFPSVEHLTAAVAERHFLDLAATVAAASAGITDPLEALLCRCRAYCHFALDHPGPYRIMVEASRPDLEPTVRSTLGQSPGRPSFLNLTSDIERCQTAGLASAGDAPAWVAALVWATLHGLAALRISRPNFPWPSLDEQVDAAVRRLLGVNRSG